jgi:hypothetical protein
LILFSGALVVAIAVGFSSPDPAVDHPGVAWVGCSATVVAATAVCVGTSVLCPPSAVVAACACMPSIFGEFEKMSCPGFGRLSP